VTLRKSRRAAPRQSCFAAFLLLGAGAVHADAGWFESGDTQLRLDLQVLNDAEVIRLPVSHWPVSRATVEYALANAKDHAATNAAVITALERVRRRLEPPRQLSYSAALRAGEPGLLRDFDTLGREKGELELDARYSSDRISVGLSMTGAADPADGQQARLDGSHATVRLGNWVFSANTLDRSWGPSNESSLILSNNARPMPSVMVERAEARAPRWSWLQWLGPYRFTFGISQMESERADIDSPLFMAWRVVFMPFKDMELGLSRTAQFCGKQLSCNLDTFGNMLAGNDNVGIDATPENEPGNQMAGFDLRWSSPIGNGPYAIFAQYIGEDESSYLPAKYLGQLGFEVWKPMASGGLVKGFAEYSNTTCAGLSINSNRGPFYNCSYNQGRFSVEGYRYRGRVIGHSADSDAETFSAGTIYSENNGRLWTLTGRFARLNHDGFDARNTVSAGPAEYGALEFGWAGRLFGEQFNLDLGVESLQPDGGKRDVEPFGFIGWRHEFAP
jgi:hypothetical protein